ncbi:Piso0_004291 [Millerozyma farinosa CBS 7064]|uniref:DNA-directed RNA polymerase subunit n=1 Tax=Pichia sorbitophila (strain ATCC MYA-4447 / BCRC 22081 / CBS 7064 / NBRC 10061 / NRRL Y-12695) TaxID=559304 RepID=G8Y806_PICSO|nr:Piso0_004291 [Millerozyma farinosa CBS 7064]CCE84736.1 Piso0_004291 [Millerozyma farinosa CBS 7064]
MFVLSKITDLIRIPPHSFNEPIEVSVRNELNKKFANKVVNNLGLAVTVWDLIDIKDGLLKPGDGGSFVEVTFRCVVWKPFVGEVLTGWVSQCTAEGIKVRLGFFDDIFVPRNYFFENCEFKPTEKAWVWRPDDETELYIDVNEKIRFRIEEEVFVNVKADTRENEDEETKANRAPPYAILASCQTDGMGCISWWD